MKNKSKAKKQAKTKGQSKATNTKTPTHTHATRAQANAPSKQNPTPKRKTPATTARGKKRAKKTSSAGSPSLLIQNPPPKEPASTTTQIHFEKIAQPKKNVPTKDHPKVQEKLKIPQSHTTTEQKTIIPEEAKKNSSSAPKPSALRPEVTGWGPAFGTKPSPKSGVVPASPLSSWYLSRGHADFIKRSEFPKEPITPAVETKLSNDTTPENGSTHKNPPSIAYSTDPSSMFFKQLAKVNWRLWYGEIDPNEILDPPLRNIPQNIQLDKQNYIDVLQNKEDESSTQTEESPSATATLLMELREQQRRSRELNKLLREQLAAGMLLPSNAQVKPKKQQ